MESRIRNLFWPVIKNEYDVEYISRQGYWICSVMALLSGVLGLESGQFLARVDTLFYYLAGVGVRQRSVFAAVAVWLNYVLVSVILWNTQGFGLMRVLGIMLLFSTVRGTWLSRQWRATNVEPPPFPMNDTLGDKLADRLPIYLWPWARWCFTLSRSWSYCFCW